MSLLLMVSMLPEVLKIVSSSPDEIKAKAKNWYLLFMCEAHSIKE